MRFLSPPYLYHLTFYVNRQMTHDPETYHDPFDFKPERFLGENGNVVELDPRLLAFGFGRR